MSPTQPPLSPRPINIHPMQTRSKYEQHNPPPHPSLFLAHSEPKVVNQALADPNWLSSMQHECTHEESHMGFSSAAF